MDLLLTETQRSLADLVARFVKKEITPNILTREKEHSFPGDIIKKAWELGIINLSIPEDIKGFTTDLISGSLIIKGLSYGDTGIATSAMCNDLANYVIARHGTGGQRERFLGPFAEKPLLASFCLTEPQAGSDNLAMTSCLARGEGGRYVLNGAKCFITNASYASQFTVFSKLGSPGSNLLACVVIPAPEVPLDEGPEVTRGKEIPAPAGGRIIIGRPEDKLGQRLSNTASVTFEDVVVPDDWIIGDRRQGFKYIIDVLDFARPMVAAIGVGLARRALDLTLSYTRERRQFSQRLCDLPVVRETLVAMWKRVELAELALIKAISRIEAEAEDRGLYASLAKNVAAEAALFTANEGLHLHGGYGFMTEYEIAKLARDAHIIDIYEGVREVQNMIIGREIV